MSVPAGMLKHRVRFERRSATADDYGNTLGAWNELLTRWAGFRAVPGRENLQAGRLESTMTGVITLRRSSDVLAITAADRGVFVAGPHAGKSFNIRSIVASDDMSTVDMTIEEGVAT